MRPGLASSHRLRAEGIPHGCPGHESARATAGVAARMARWSAAHWKTATFGWLAFVVVVFALGIAVGPQTIDYETSGPGESGHADRVLHDDFAGPAAENVLVQSRP